jgi:RNA polymerase sigma factor (sigma-70 family)
MAREELERIEAAFGQLSEDQQQVILLSRIVGLPHSAVAEELGRTPAATRSLLSRGLSRLAVLLESQ